LLLINHLYLFQQQNL